MVESNQRVRESLAQANESEVKVVANKERIKQLIEESVVIEK